LLYCTPENINSRVYALEDLFLVIRSLDQLWRQEWELSVLQNRDISSTQSPASEFVVRISDRFSYSLRWFRVNDKASAIEVHWK
jgi:hypothetical protein